VAITDTERAELGPIRSHRQSGPPDCREQSLDPPVTRHGAQLFAL